MVMSRELTTNKCHVYVPATGGEASEAIFLKSCSILSVAIVKSHFFAV